MAQGLPSGFVIMPKARGGACIFKIIPPAFGFTLRSMIQTAEKKLVLKAIDELGRSVTVADVATKTGFQLWLPLPNFEQQLPLKPGAPGSEHHR